MSTIWETLGTLAKPLLLSKGAPKIRIDDWTFRIHYRMTALLFFLCSGLVCMKEYLGDHIKCVHMQDNDGSDPVIPRKVLETYCFITTTFTVPYDEKKSLLKMDYQTATMLGGPSYIPGRSEQVFHAYYQWVPFYLFFMGLLFTLPHALWKSADGNKIRNLVQELNVPELPVGSSPKCRQISLLAEYIVRSSGTHWAWAMSFIVCEFMNLVVLFGCLYLTDIFLGREFSTYGPEVLHFLEKDPEDRMDPMSRVFPRVTKCNMNTYGPSGTIQRFDALCILPLNIINEKIFTFVWFWLMVSGFIAVVALTFRMLTILSPRLRCLALGIDDETIEFRAKGMLKKLTLSDWILLHLLKQNMDQITFGKLIYSIDEQF